VEQHDAFGKRHGAGRPGDDRLRAQCRLEAEQSQAREKLADRAETLREVRETARLTAQMEVLEARENRMALALIALLAAVGIGYAAAVWRGDEERRKHAMIAAGTAASALVIALLLWFTRPGLAEIENRVAAAVAKAMEFGIEVTDIMAIGEINGLIMAAMDKLQAEHDAKAAQQQAQAPTAPAAPPEQAPRKRRTDTAIAAGAARSGFTGGRAAQQQSFA
jgi:hypothetical protein